MYKLQQLLWDHKNKNLHIWSMPSRKTTLLSQKNLCYHVYPFPEEATGCVVQKNVLKIKSSEDLLFYFNKICFPTKSLKIFKNTYFEGRPGITSSDCLRKMSPLLVLRKPMLSRKQHSWATNTFYCKYEPHEVNLCNIHVIPEWLLLFLSGLRRQKW